MPIMPQDRALTESTCPSWCAERAGHAPETVDRDGTAYTTHRALLPAADGAPSVELSQIVLHQADGSVEICDAEVIVGGAIAAPLPLDAVRILSAGLALAVEMGAARV